MTAANRGQRMLTLSVDDLRRMIELDERRPGPARARLIVEQIPVWAIVGYAGALAGTTESASMTDEVITRVAVAYAIRREAVQAALLYYGEHRRAIDALLEANVAALA